MDPFHPKASGVSFAGFQGLNRAEAAGNDEDEDDRLEDQQLLMSRLACSKVPLPIRLVSAVEQLLKLCVCVCV